MKSSGLALFTAFICILLVSAISVHAVPVISSVGGGVTHNGVITINGDGFGTKSTAPPVLWDTVDNQSAYSALNDGDPIPVGGSNPWPAAQNVHYSTSRPQRGVSTAAYTGAGDDTSVRNKHLDGATKMYVSWWWRPSGNWQSQTGSNKITRQSDACRFTASPNEQFSWCQGQYYLYHVTTYPSGVYLFNNWMDWNVVGLTNEWNRQELYWDNTTHNVYIYTNGKRVGTGNYTGVSNDINCVDQIGLDTNDGTNITVDYDDIYLDNSPARVEICSGSTWASRSHCEIQISSAWSSSSITATVNRGSFGASNSVYLYVVDASNQANSSGYAITIGGNAAPMPPVNLRISP